MLTKTLSEAKKKQRNILIKAMNNDIGSIDSAKDSWNPAQISERAKDISYIRSLVDTWNPAQLNEALRMLDLPVIDTWNPAQIEEQRGNLVFYLTERTLTGNPITLNILGNLTPEVTGLEVYMSPIQDLNGYEYPWFDGAGKNKLPLTLDKLKSLNTSGTWSENVYSYLGIDYTVLLNDGGNVIGIKANGTASDNSFMQMRETVNNDGGIINGCTDGSETTYRIRISYYTTGSGAVQHTQYSNNGDYTLHENTSSWDIYSWGIVISSGATVSDVMFYPMLRLADVTDGTFEPYSNICPISGRTEVNVTRTAGEDVEKKTHEYSETIYGGTDDFVNGGCSVTMSDKIDLGSLTWVKATGYFYSVITGLTPPKAPSSSTVPFVGNCESYKVSFLNDTANGIITMNNIGNTIYIRDNERSEYTAVEFKEFLSGKYFCYELENPTTISTTPEEITLLKGTNVLSTDGDSIELKYKQNF